MSTPSSNKALRAAAASRAPSRTAQRNSGIELLKLLAMFLIVISHTVQTLSAESDAVDFSDYVFRFAEASSDPRVPILAMFFYFGTLGNTVFFVCTAWFLLDRERNSKERAVRMLADIWVISVSILLIVLALRRGDLGGTLILKSLFPTLFSLNWYLTCYLLFYLIHPFLNQLIRGMSQRTLFRVAVLMFLLYSVCDLLHAFLNNYFTVSSFFFISTLIVWVMIYFVIAYVKYYLPEKSNSRALNAGLLLFGAVGLFGSVALTNVLGLRFPILNNPLIVWKTACNPFLLILVIGAFQLFRMAEFHSKVVNYLSGLTLFIYLIHENLLLRSLYRPVIWQYLYTRFGYSRLILLVLLLSVVIYLCSILASMLYFHTLHRLVTWICGKCWPFLSGKLRALEDRILRVR